MNRKLIAMFLVLSMMITAFAGVISISAEEQTETPLIDMLSGAQIRCAEPSGIRFISKVSKETAELAKQEGNEMGTYIFRYEDYKASGAKTPAEFLAMEGAKFAKIVAKNGIHEKEDGVYLYAALVNIKTTNYTRDFAAVSYVKLGDEISWSEFNAYDNVRNIREVSIKAYNDYAYEENAVIDGYTYKYQVAEGVWSCYSPDQRKVIASYDNAILRLEIDEENNVRNWAAKDYELIFFEGIQGKMKIEDDATYGKVLNAGGGSHNSGVYNLKSKDFDTLLADGFSYEIIFRTTGSDKLSGALKDYGILNYEEGGGFAFNVTPNDDGTFSIRACVGVGSGYSSNLTYKLDNNVWYHCVFSYDGNNATLFVNGKQVATTVTNGAYNPVEFSSNDPYICIGANAQAYNWNNEACKGFFGFQGDIAVCNIYSDSVTAEGATALYEQQELKKVLNTKHTLRADENGEFKVLVLSDVQHNNAELSEETLNNIETIVKRENPDLVVFNGDNCYAIKSVEIMKTYITNMTKYLEDNKIPWAHVYGNHDHENGISKAEQQELYESFEYCVSKAGDEELYGLGNYVLPVLAHDSDRILYNVWCLDSGAARGVYADFEGQHVRTDDGNYFYAHYDPMQQNQVDWYVETSALLQKYNGDQVIPGMMAFHIPLQEMHTAWTLRNEEGADFVGEKRENISAHAQDVPLFEAILERGDVKAIINSHDHVNDFAVTYQGVRFAYTACIGTKEYHADEMLGGRVVQFSPEAETGMTTYMSYVQDREEVSDDTDIFNLVIDSDNNVKNGVYGRPVLTSHDYEGSTKTVKTDETLGKKVLSFTGGSNYPSVYDLPISYLQPLFSDGFSYEIMFKVDDGVFNYSTKSYVGILDMEEAGGWGLNLYRGATADKPILYAEVAYASTWNSLKYTINTNEWYHCVYSFDGTNIALYINGVEVLTATVSGDYRAPSFSNGANPYICIGGCAQSVTEGVTPTELSTGMNGFAGDIAKIKIMTNPVTYEQARAMAKAEGMDRSNDPILDLVIGEDNSVTNGSFSRNELTSHDYTGSVKQVVTSEELARKVLSFSRGEGYRDATASTYNIAANEYNSLMADGFTLETMIKVNSTNFSTNYIGVIDYVEAGGWGLIIKKGSSSDKALLQFEFGYHNGSSRSYVYPEYELDVGTWYHCVVVYDGASTVSLYVNGVNVSSKTVSGAWYVPSFSSRAGEEYICIGGCSAAWSNVDPDKSGNERSTGINGFMGEIAKVKILPDAVSAAEARAMAKAEGMDENNDPVLDLVIDSDGTVRNGAEGGSPLTSVDVSGSEKIVDPEKQTITFNGNSSSSSHYSFPTANLENDFKDGFSFEIMFKITTDVAYWQNGYLGVMDHEQSGGFGLVVYDEGDDNNGFAKIAFEFARDDGNGGNKWETIYGENIKVSDDSNEYWYHCVGTYDAEAGVISLYVNGVLAGTVEIPTNYNPPKFYKTETYVSIGACADDGSSIRGFDGSISICRIYSNPVTAEQAAEMYQKAIA